MTVRTPSLKSSTQGKDMQGPLSAPGLFGFRSNGMHGQIVGLIVGRARNAVASWEQRPGQTAIAGCRSLAMRERQKRLLCVAGRLKHFRQPAEVGGKGERGG